MKTILYKGRVLNEVNISNITIHDEMAWFDVTLFSVRHRATFDTVWKIAEQVCRLHLDGYFYKPSFHIAPTNFNITHRVSLQVREKECMEYWIENNK